MCTRRPDLQERTSSRWSLCKRSMRRGLARRRLIVGSRRAVCPIWTNKAFSRQACRADVAQRARARTTHAGAQPRPSTPWSKRLPRPRGACRGATQPSEGAPGEGWQAAFASDDNVVASPNEVSDNILRKLVGRHGSGELDETKQRRAEHPLSLLVWRPERPRAVGDARPRARTAVALYRASLPPGPLLLRQCKTMSRRASDPICVQTTITTRHAGRARNTTKTSDRRSTSPWGRCCCD